MARQGATLTQLPTLTVAVGSILGDSLPGINCSTDGGDVRRRSQSLVRLTTRLELAVAVGKVVLASPFMASPQTK